MTAAQRTFVAAVLSLMPALLSAQQPPVAPPVVVTPVQPTAAQAAAAALGKPVSNDQIANAIKQSGLSEAQVRAKLQAAGYDPGLADPFFAAVGQQSQTGAAAATSAAQAPGSDFVKALVSLGILSSPTSPTDESTDATKADSAKKDALYAGVFGKDIFDRASTAFDPVTSGPVDPAYRLGVGDQLQLIVTGQVELAYQLSIGRDGTVVIPQVGQISLAGLTLDAARQLLRIKMGESYSGLKTGATRLDLTVAQIRSIAVFVIGEVENPGAMQVNALATVFYALAKAGGPTDRGSFRDIEVRRGGKTIETLDLYDYLLKGDATGDIRLEQGDVIFVPLNERAVAVVGAVRRPRIFELRHNEGFNDLLRYAGGLMPTASTDRVQIDRILPAAQRQPGFDRVKVDVYLHGNLDSLSHVTLNDGDIVTVFSIGDLRRNVVTVTGQVFQPGDYELLPKMTLGQLISDAQGFLPWAIAGQVKVLRPIVQTGQSQLVSVDATTEQGKQFLLEEFDSVEVLDSRLAYPSGTISVAGAVHFPQTRAFADNETLADAIERAGGFLEFAQVVDVFRRVSGETYSDTTSKRFEFPITPNFFHDSSVAQFILRRDDHIIVRVSPGFRAQKFVSLTGRFTHDGTYAISDNIDRVSDVVARAGGTLPGAYAAGFRLVRGGKPVAIDFQRAMRGDPENDLPLLDGDSLIITRDPGTVFVTGAVNRPSLIKYEPGRAMDDYIDMAGGVSDTGRVNSAIIEYPSGFSREQKRVAFFFHSSPPVVSGSTISIPFKPRDTTSTSEIWGRVLAATSSIASLILAIAAVKRL